MVLQVWLIPHVSNKHVYIVVHIYTYQDCSMIFGVSVAVLPGWQGHCGHGPGC